MDRLVVQCHDLQRVRVYVEHDHLGAIGETVVYGHVRTEHNHDAFLQMYAIMRRHPTTIQLGQIVRRTKFVFNVTLKVFVIEQTVRPRKVLHQAF